MAPVPSSPSFTRNIIKLTIILEYCKILQLYLEPGTRCCGTTLKNEPCRNPISKQNIHRAIEIIRRLHHMTLQSIKESGILYELDCLFCHYHCRVIGSAAQFKSPNRGPGQIYGLVKVWEARLDQALGDQDVVMTVVQETLIEPTARDTVNTFNATDNTCSTLAEGDSRVEPESPEDRLDSPTVQQAAHKPSPVEQPIQPVSAKLRPLQQCALTPAPFSGPVAHTTRNEPPSTPIESRITVRTPTTPRHVRFYNPRQQINLAFNRYQRDTPTVFSPTPARLTGSSINKAADWATFPKKVTPEVVKEVSVKEEQEQIDDATPTGSKSEIDHLSDHDVESNAMPDQQFEYAMEKRIAWKHWLDRLATALIVWIMTTICSGFDSAR